ncbi:MAG: FAD-binding oxidoreductase [Anaerolineae bacterium]|nr:FAD-binding oxidoreductase [Anaerolineae bacterium]
MQTPSIIVTNTRSGNPGRTGWNAILPSLPPARVLDETISADWLVIGGGFAGLAAARRLSQLRPQDRTVLLEAVRIGDGPAGRSSGFMIDLPHDISAESYTGGLEADKKQTEMNRTALAFAAQAAAEYDFSPELFDPRGKVNVAAGDAGDRHNREYAAYLTAMGEPFTVLDAADLQRISGTDYYTGGLHTPGAAMIQPAGFVRGLAQGLSLARAVDIFENSPVTAMVRERDVWRVETPRGVVSTPKVILAVNGHIQSFGFFRRRLIHIFLYASMTRALRPDEVKRLGGEPTWEFVPADPLGSTVRRISGQGGHRILMRNKFKYSASLEASERSVQAAARHHDRSFAARFPLLEGVEIESRWGGRLCLSWNSVPVFGEIEPGLFAAVCQNGLGASKGILSGMLAAEYAAGVDNPYLADYLAADPPSRLPPEPLATIGATVYLNWKEWRAGREK